MIYSELTPVVNFPSENVPAPPSPNCTLHSSFNLPVVLYSSTYFWRSSTHEPCSIMIGLYPLSINVKAQNNPAGPAPTIIGL